MYRPADAVQPFVSAGDPGQLNMVKKRRWLTLKRETKRISSVSQALGSDKVDPLDMLVPMTKLSEYTRVGQVCFCPVYLNAVVLLQCISILLADILHNIAWLREHRACHAF